MLGEFLSAPGTVRGAVAKRGAKSQVVPGGARSGAAKIWGQKRPGDGRPMNVPSSEIRPDISVCELFFWLPCNE
jgi:hypothetical protein